MKLSVCPKCYKEGKIVEGKFINKVYNHNDFNSWSVYYCKECKDSYKEN